MSGARGVAAPVPRTGLCWQEEKTARDGTPEPKKEKNEANCWQTEQLAFRQSYRKQPSVVVCDSPDTVHSTRSWRRQVLRNAKFPLLRAAHSRRRNRQCSKLGSSAVAVHRRGHRDACLDAEAARIQKIVEIPQLQYTDEKADITAESSEDSVDAASSVLRKAGS